jgi:hypothetical protein
LSKTWAISKCAVLNRDKRLVGIPLRRASYVSRAIARFPRLLLCRSRNDHGARRNAQ